MGARYRKPGPQAQATGQARYTSPVVDPLSTLYLQHRDHLWGIAYRMTGSAADAEDLVQDTFRRALERPPADRDRSLRPWLATITSRLAIDCLRRRKTRSRYGPWLPSPVDTSAGELGSRAEHSDLETTYDLMESVTFAFLLALESLTVEQRAALVLRDVLGYSSREVAEALETSPENVRVLLHRGRKAMARYRQRRRPPCPSRVEQAKQALMRLMTTIAADDPEGVMACLREDVMFVSDSGGEFSAAHREVVGARDVMRLLLGLTRKSPVPTNIQMGMFNGMPSLYYHRTPQRPRDAPRVWLSIEIDDAGKVGRIHSVLATDKLTALPPQ